MKKIIFLSFVFALFAASVMAQEKKAEQKTTQKKSSTTTSGAVKLDDLHLEAIIEKPSVSIMPKRVEPDLEKVEFITRKFDRELKMISEELFDLQVEKRNVAKIRDVEKILKKKRN